MQRPDTDEITYAEAGRLDYDFSTGVVAFSEQATITEGGNQISSNYLVYNIKEQRINAQSGGDGEPKVRIIYTPAETSSLIPSEIGAIDGVPDQKDEAAPPIDSQDSVETEDSDSDTATAVDPGGEVSEDPGADET